ncbi:TonB-dependent receptor [Chitinophaga sp. MM2321]|uniref:SusC/RagA family TonB-linked outer membrane protein n=1 Tax=Chitinophaga sp. MM2321 TaxID=3137178 RepID=UPI0032D57B45
MKKIVLPLFIVFCLPGSALADNGKAPEDMMTGTPRTNHTAFSVRSKPAEVIITGTVRSEKGENLPGVSIQVKGGKSATVSNDMGKYTIKVPDEEAVLIFTYMGYITQERKVGNATVLHITLLEQLEKLNEVVVVGYGTQKKVSVTGAIATVTTKDLLQSPVANISNSLVGRMSGLLATQSSGEPGNDQSKLRIRGVGTFTGSQDPLIMVDGIEVANYNNIDPNEIASVTILKDASSTAIYGVRGANGVLLITTQRGKLGKPQLSFTSNVAQTSFTSVRTPMNSADYATSYNAAKKYDSYITGSVYTPTYSDEAISKYRSGEDPIFYPNTNWYDLLLKKSSLQTQNNISISGGTEKVKYFVSGGLFTQEALFKNTTLSPDFDAQVKFKRYNLRSNFNFDITKRLKASLDLSLQTENRRGANWNTNRVFQGLGDGNPLYSPGVVDGKVVQLGMPGPVNPINIMLGAGYKKEYRNYLNGAVRMDYDLDMITKGFSIHGKISYQNFNNKNDIYSKGLVDYLAKRLPDGNIVYIPQSLDDAFGFDEVIGKNRRTYSEIGLDYNRTFGSHTVTGLLLYNQSKLFDPNLAFLVPNGYQGVVGRATYDYKGRYLAEFNIGYNGTENFAEGKRFGFFPAYSLGWVPSQEAFFPKNDVLTFIKIRGSYGEVGNDKIGGARFLYRPTSFTYSNNPGYYFGEAGSNFTQYNTAVEGALGNGDLTWERALKKDLGIELSFWKDKITITADWFNENRDNILASKQNIPAITGAILPAYNFGKMVNKGFDADIAFNSEVNSFRYWVKANVTFARNKIVFMDEIPQPMPYQNRSGQRLGQYFGLIAEGLYNSWAEVNDANRPVSQWNNNKIQPGDIRYKDVNGDGRITDDDRVPIGYSNFPEKMGGLSFGGSFKGFDFSVLFLGATNVSVHMPRLAMIGFPLNSGAINNLLSSWSQERYDQGLPINFPHLSIGYETQQHNYKESTYWIRDASYVRLKNMEVGYTLPGNMLKRVGISSARFYLNANNLLTWSDMDPGIDPESPSEIDGTEPYPLTRTVNVGVNIKF